MVKPVKALIPLIFFCLFSLLLLQSCTTMVSTGESLEQEIPVKLEGFTLEIFFEQEDRAGLLIRNTTGNTLELTGRIDQALLYETLETKRVQTGTKTQYFCDDFQCWTEEVPVYETREIVHQVYSDIRLTSHSIIINPHEKTTIYIEFRNSSDQQNPVHPDLIIRNREQDYAYRIPFSTELFMPQTD